MRSDKVAMSLLFKLGAWLPGTKFAEQKMNGVC